MALLCIKVANQEGAARCPCSRVLPHPPDDARCSCTTNNLSVTFQSRLPRPHGELGLALMQDLAFVWPAHKERCQLLLLLSYAPMLLHVSLSCVAHTQVLVQSLALPDYRYAIRRSLPVCSALCTHRASQPHCSFPLAPGTERCVGAPEHQGLRMHVPHTRSAGPPAL